MKTLEVLQGRRVRPLRLELVDTAPPKLVATAEDLSHEVLVTQGDVIRLKFDPGSVLE